ncbi:hypothetical protein fHeYen902_001c [Yersinia phage fHe-Yen9-02]|nr:hypothetical protein fHeYen902_001c [Yersinia phage fHe-Yen9-02]
MHKKGFREMLAVCAFSLLPHLSQSASKGVILNRRRYRYSSKPPYKVIPECYLTSSE